MLVIGISTGCIEINYNRLQSGSTIQTIFNGKHVKINTQTNSRDSFTGVNIIYRETSTLF